MISSKMKMKNRLNSSILTKLVKGYNKQKSKIKNIVFSHQKNYLTMKLNLKLKKS